MLKRKMDEGPVISWNIDTSKLYNYKFNSPFVMYDQVEPLQRPDPEQFNCDLNPLDMYECKSCMFQNHYKVNINEHYRITHEEKEGNLALDKILGAYHCQKCHFKSHSLIVITRHVFSCSEQAKKTRGRKIIENDYDEWYTYKVGKDLYRRCKHCFYKTQSLANMRNHFKARHKTVENTKWFNCDKCRARFRNPAHLRLHIDMIHSEKITSGKCDKCSYEGKTMTSLKYHILRNHLEPDERNWYKCDQCLFGTNLKGSLRRHILAKHTPDSQGIKPYECDKCPYKGKTSTCLRYHILWKHLDLDEVEWFQCEMCPFKTKMKTTLNRHVLCKHVSPKAIKWCECPQCPFKTKLKPDLMDHISKTHAPSEEINWIECAHCLKKFRQRHILVHMYREHKIASVQVAV